MHGLIYKLRGIKDWPSTTATVTSTTVVGTGGKAGLTMNVYFYYVAASSTESGKLFVDDNSSVYGLASGDTFSIQFNPAHPSSYYCTEAKSLSQTIRRTVFAFSAALAIGIVLVILLGTIFG